MSCEVTQTAPLPSGFDCSGQGAAGLLEALPGERSLVALTGTGRARHRQVRTGIEEVTTRLFAGLPAEDLATAGRVFAIITARANAEV
jgi:hypothetical protein